MLTMSQLLIPVLQLAAENIEDPLGTLAVMHITLMLIIFIQDSALIAIK